MERLQHAFVHKPLCAALAIGILSMGGGVAWAAPADVPASAATTAPPPAPVTADKQNAEASAPQQVTSEDDKSTQLEGVVVTGYRESINNALSEKRNANAVVEVINAQNISQFPAKDIADALVHVPGVIIGRSGGEGKNVSVRGLDPSLTLTELNGNFIATADTESGLTRSFNYLLMPARMIGSVKLYKSQEARFDEGGIGGTVIMHTRRPLEMPSGKGFVSVEGTRGDSDNTSAPQLGAMYSWHSKDERFGILVGASYQKRKIAEYSANASSWHWWANDYDEQPPVGVGGGRFPNEANVDLWPGGGAVDQAGNAYSGYWMPQQFSIGEQRSTRVRKGGQVTLQFKPTEDFVLTGNYFRFDLKNDYITNTLEIPEWGLPTGSYADEQGRQLAPNGLTFDPSNTIVTGADYRMPSPGTGCAALTNPVTGASRQPSDVCSQQYPWLTGRYAKTKATSQSINIKGEWSSDVISGSFDVGHTWAYGGPTIDFRMSAKPRRFINGQWQNGNQVAGWDLGGTPSMNVSPDVLENMRSGVGQIDLGSTDSGYTNTKSQQNYFQADFSAYFGNGWLNTLDFGVKYRNTHASQSTGENRWYCPGTDVRFQDCSPSAGNMQAGFLQPDSIKRDSEAYHANVFPAINFPAYYHYLNDTFGPARRVNQPENFVGLSEKISAAYVQANYEVGRARGNLGVRVVRTTQDVTVNNEVTTLKQEYYHDADGHPLNCPPNGVNVKGSPCNPGDFQYRPQSEWEVKSFELGHRSRTYTNVLPSFNFAYTLPHDVVLRFAASKAMARPNYSDILVLGNLTHVTQAYYDDRKQFGARLPGWYGSGGNKDLKEFEATQYDLGAAWYYQEGSVLGIGLFDKKVKNFVVPVTVTQDVDVGGEQVTVKDFSTIGNGRSGTSKGVEFYMQHTFPIGFGVIANYTLNKTSTTDVLVNGEVVGKSNLVGSAKNAANLSLFYQKNGLLLRATSNWTGTVTGGLASGLTVYDEPYHQIDLNGSYDFNKHVAVTASVLNLTKETPRSHLGDDTSLRLNSLYYSGRQYYLGLTYSFGP